jgi:hypothetical protein
LLRHGRGEDRGWVLGGGASRPPRVYNCPAPTARVSGSRVKQPTARVLGGRVDGMHQRTFTTADVDEWPTARRLGGRPCNPTAKNPGGRKRGQIPIFFKLGSNRAKLRAKGQNTKFCRYWSLLLISQRHCRARPGPAQRVAVETEPPGGRVVLTKPPLAHSPVTSGCLSETKIRSCEMWSASTRKKRAGSEPPSRANAHVGWGVKSGGGHGLGVGWQRCRCMRPSRLVGTWGPMEEDAATA